MLAEYPPLPHDFHKGQWVRNTRTGEEAVVHETYPQSWEDNVEVVRRDGTFATWDGRRYVVPCSSRPETQA